MAKGRRRRAGLGAAAVYKSVLDAIRGAAGESFYGGGVLPWGRGTGRRRRAGLGAAAVSVSVSRRETRRGAGLGRRLGFGLAGAREFF